jgi:hypothetical protein
MGTSSDFGGGRSAEWTALRRASTSFGKDGGGERAGRVLARLVQALGGAGAAAAAASAGAGMRSAQQVGALGRGLAGPGLTPTLESLGLQRLVGSDRFEVIEGLLDQIAGDGDALEGQAARTAACDVLDELFKDAETYDQLEAIELDVEGVLTTLQTFLAAYVFALLAPALDERLNRLGDPNLVRRREREMRDYTKAVIELELEDADPLGVDWSGEDGRRILDGAVRAVFEQLEALEL